MNDITIIGHISRDIMIYKGNEVTELPPEVRGMVYHIYYTDDTYYIGSKIVRSEVKVKPLVGMRSNAVRRKLKESNWKTYEGSSKLTEGKTIKSKVILYLTTDKRSMTFLEQRELFHTGAIFQDNYLNQNIGGKFFDNALDGLYTGEVEHKHLFNQEEK